MREFDFKNNPTKLLNPVIIQNRKLPAIEKCLRQFMKVMNILCLDLM